MSTASPTYTPASLQRSAQTNSSAKTLMQKYATAATAVTFVVVSITGVVLFFHIGEDLLMGVHQWLGMAFVAAGVFHAVKHVKSLSKLLTKTRAKALMAVTAAITVFMITMASLQPGGGNPMKSFAQNAVDAPLGAVAQVAGKTTAELNTAFTQAGIANVSMDQSLAQIANTNGLDARRLFGLVMNGTLDDD